MWSRNLFRGRHLFRHWRMTGLDVLVTSTVGRSLNPLVHFQCCHCNTQVITKCKSGLGDRSVCTVSHAKQAACVTPFNRLYTRVSRGRESWTTQFGTRLVIHRSIFPRRILMTQLEFDYETASKYWVLPNTNNDFFALFGKLFRKL